MASILGGLAVAATMGSGAAVRAGVSLCGNETNSCNTDAECDDGNFCNGEEFCAQPTTAGGGGGLCACGTPPSCDDGNACTTGDTCSNGACGCGAEPGSYTTQVDIYLNPTGLANDTRFDWSSAYNGIPTLPAITCSHRRDVVFNCGFYNDTDGTGSGARFVCSAGFNATRGSSFPKNPGHFPNAITTPGWYTFRHVFKDVAGAMVIDMEILPLGSSTPAASWTLYASTSGGGIIITSPEAPVGTPLNPTDFVSGPLTNVGGSRYGYIVFNEIPSLAIDSSMNTENGFSQGFEVDNSGWNLFGGTNDATRVPTGTNGVASASGSFHAEAAYAPVPPSDGSGFTDWGSNRNLRCAFPAGTCPSLDCDDHDVCTDDSCDPIEGCVYTYNTAACDDGLFCTVNDVCSLGVCVGDPRDCSSTDSVFVDFENPPYATGSIHLQDGWSSSGASTGSCALYDHAVATNTYGYASFDGQSLRMSNAVTSGCFGDQTFSKSLSSEVGETTADNGGMSGGPRGTHFEAEWSFASTVPGAEQPGLSVVASPDRGDGARMSWVQMTDTPSGLEVNFFDFQDVAPYGSAGNHADGCGTGDDFFSANVASGLDRTVPHTIRVVLDTCEGPRNDTVEVYVDGVLGHTGTTWEDYFRWCDESLPSDVSRTVDSILFRTGGNTPAPATLGHGFVIDNLTVRSGFAPAQCLAGACDEVCGRCVQVPADEGGPCKDENACTTEDVCVDGVCLGVDTSDVDCDDLNFCTVDTCDPLTGCEHSAPTPGCCNFASDCPDDADICTQKVCRADHSCGQAPIPNCCHSHAECPDDGIYCNGVPRCIANTCQTTRVPCPANQCNEATRRCRIPVSGPPPVRPSSSAPVKP